MPRSIAALTGATLVLIAAAAPSGAADVPKLSTDRQCYTHNQALKIRGSGFPPNATQGIFRDGAYIGSLTATPFGALVAQPIAAPEPPTELTALRTYTLTSSSSQSGTPVTGRTTFDVVHTNVGVSPALITPGKVMYTALGFTYGSTLYVHYLRGSRLVASRRVGHLSPPCGRLHKRVRMFLFRPVPPGLYTLIFDNSKRYLARYRPNFSFQASVPQTFR